MITWSDLRVRYRVHYCLPLFSIIESRAVLNRYLSQSDFSKEMQSVKCVVVGSGTVGKTCLLVAYAKKVFPEEYIPTVYDNYSTTLTVDGIPINLLLLDTPGQDDYDRLRPVSYPKTDVFIICFSVVNPETFDSVWDKWYPEVAHYCPDAPIILVGTKTDLRRDAEAIRQLRRSHRTPVYRSEAEFLKEEIGSVKYMECSAMTRDGVQAVFEEAVKAALQARDPSKRKGKRRRKAKCVLL